MLISTFLKRAVSTCVATVVTAACGGPQVQRVVPVTQVPLVQMPLSKSPKGTLIYAVGDESSFIFGYPHGKLLEEIPTTGFSACSDHNGNVYVTQVRRIAKYEHGATQPVKIYQLAAGTVYACSVDPKTQDLATVVFCVRGCGEEIVILRKHGPKSRYRVGPLSSLLYCAYDDNGDLFVDGYNGSQFGLAELPSGADHFVAIALKKQIGSAAQIQWDGTNLALETRIDPVIYRLAISKRVAQIVGRTRLQGIGYKATQSWIEGGTIAVPSAAYNKRPMEIFLYTYPAGGEPTKIIKGFIRGGNHAMIDGVTFSVPR